jgi:hypothetical protein
MPNKARNTSITTRSISQNHPPSQRQGKNRNRDVTTPSTPKVTHPGQPKDSTPTVQSPSSPESHSSPTIINNQSNSTQQSSSHSSSSSSSETTTLTSSKQHKIINYLSTNRRQCKRVTDDLSRSTPDQNNLSQRRHEHTTRITLKLNCPSSGNAEETLLSLFSEFVDELVRSDETAAVLPWRSIHRSKGSINKPTEIPKNSRFLRTYMHRFFISRTPDKPFITYPGIHIGHNHPLPDLREDMRMWLQDGKHGIYSKMLQVEDSSEIGWLLYSTKEMDAGALADEIEDLVGVKIGLRWKVIDVGAKGKLPESQMVRALIVEVDSKSKWDVQRKMINYFGRNIKNPDSYPNGIRLRFVKNKRDGINAIEKSKIDKLRARQKAFLQNIVTSTTWEILQLDYAPIQTQPTLRQMIMELTTEEGNIPLFHCVDLDWSGEGFVYQYAPAVKVEAECIMNTLLPILHHKYPDADVQKFFTQECVDRCEGYTWDEEQGIVVDKLVNNHLQIIDDENLLGFSFTINPDEAQSDQPDRPPTAVPLYNDSDSVSTFAKPGGTTFLTPSARNNDNYLRSDIRSHDNTSVTSSTSTVTIETINNMENSISALTTHVLNSDKKFEELMTYLRSNKAGGQASSTINQSGIPANSNIEAGEDSQSISGKVP